MRDVAEGSKVRCVRGNIAAGLGAGEIGYVHGFARLSAHHPREVWVGSAPDASAAGWCGWFWLCDVEPVD